MNAELDNTELARTYLESKGPILFGDFSLAQPDRFDKAVQWLARVLDDIDALVVAGENRTWEICTEAGETIIVTQSELPGFKVESITQTAP